MMTGMRASQPVVIGVRAGSVGVFRTMISLNTESWERHSVRRRE